MPLSHVLLSTKRARSAFGTPHAEITAWVRLGIGADPRGDEAWLDGDAYCANSHFRMDESS